MIDTTEMEFENFLTYQPMSGDDTAMQYSLDTWSDTLFTDSYSSFQPAAVDEKCLDSIEQIYMVLHKCIDQIMSNMPISTPSRLDEIKEQNCKLINKLRALESTITLEKPAKAAAAAAAAAAVFGPAPPMCTPANTGAQYPTLVSNTPTIPLASGDDCHSPPYRKVRAPADAVSHDSKLTKKLLQVGNREARLQVEEFAARLNMPKYQSELPNVLHFPTTARLTDVPNFLQLVASLGLTIEGSIFGEQNCRLKKRIALAHFYHAYTLAQNHPDMFLSWCDNQQVQPGSVIPKGGNRSIIQQRFADLVFSRAETSSGVTHARSLEKGDVAKRRTAKIQMWRKSGKKWAQFIQRFGYGILLLLPCSLSDEDLRIASDEAIACGLDLIDSRKHVFADVLRQANELLEAHFFSQDRNAQLSHSHISDRLDSDHWDDLLHTSASVA